MIYTSKKANAILKCGDKYVSNVFEYDNCLGLHEYEGFGITENIDEAMVFKIKRAKKIINNFPKYKLAIQCVKTEAKC